MAPVVGGRSSNWLHEHAVDEFVRYAEKATGHRPERATAPEAGRRDEPVVCIGGPDANPMTSRLVEKGLLAIDWQELGRDGFIEKSVQDAGRRCLVLAGATDIATLYAVYDYLERFCGIGFFVDGEYVPPIGILPTEGIDWEEHPRFTDRLWNSDMGHWSLSKYQSYFWRLDDWKRQTDWMVKRRLNMTNYLMLSDSFLSVRREIFGASPLGPKAEYTSAGYPSGWAYPEGYREALTRDILAYARGFGIRFIYLVDFGRVFPEFRAQHPELRYLADDYGSWFFSPDDPRAMEVTQGYLRRIIETFGTDHLYLWTPYCEAGVGASADEEIALKTTAASKLCAALQAVDPDAIWVGDTWDFSCRDAFWTREHVIRYLDSLPKERMYIYETGFDTLEDYYPGGFYARNDYYRGAPWALGIIHSYSSNDEWHGDMAHAVAKSRMVAEDPAAARCRGYFLVPELTNANVAFWHLATKLAWDPLEVEVDPFLADYVLTRYGRSSFGNMLEVWKIVQGAALCGPLIAPPREDTFNQSYYSQALRFLPFTDRPDNRAPASLWTEKSERLAASLALALTERERQAGNQLYLNDMVDLARTVNGFRFNRHILQAYAAWQAGQEASFEEHALAALSAIDSTASILSTRADFSLGCMVESVLAVPGANPAVAEMIRQSCIAGKDYNGNDVYELLVLFYRPRIQLYLSLLRGKMRRGERTVAAAEFDDGHLREAWRCHGHEALRVARFDGCTLNAIQRVVGEGL